MVIVQKYGGTSLSGEKGLRRVAERIRSAAKQGRVIAVVSARGHLTDRLSDSVSRGNTVELNRERDACLAAGEQIAAAQLAALLCSMETPAVSLTGWQAGIRTDGKYGDAEIQEIRPERIYKEFSEGKNVIVAGFQGINADGNVTTLGRGGSDTTAAALAAVFGVKICQIFTDVDGVYDRDPHLWPDAEKFSYLTYSQMKELIARKARVLHSRCVETAEKYGIILEVCSAEGNEPGTRIGP